MRLVDRIILIAACLCLAAACLIFAPGDGGEAERFPAVGTGGHGVAVMEDGSARVDINAADEDLLVSLPGIGPTLAGRILARRAEAGPLRSVDELLEVPGIGEKTLEALRDYVTVTD